MGQAAQPHAVSMRDEQPKLITVYCVQTYWRDSHKLATGRFFQYRSQERALEVGENQARRQAGVVVFSVTGNPEVDYWEEPRVIATHGDVPAA